VKKKVFRNVAKPLLILPAAVALVVAIGTLASADTYLETFDGSLNSNYWNLDSGGNDWVTADGKLSVTRTNATQGSLAFVPQLIGDFDVQFEYSLFWPSTYGFGDRIHISLFTNTPQHSYVVGHVREGAVFGVAVDPGARYFFGHNSPSGKMRVTRTGSDVLMQYSSGVDWVTLQTGSDPRDMWLKLDNYIHNGFTAGSRVEIDNFSITAGRFSGVP
jgi:hypothetical protein